MSTSSTKRWAVSSALVIAAGVGGGLWLHEHPAPPDVPSVGSSRISAENAPVKSAPLAEAAKPMPAAPAAAVPAPTSDQQAVAQKKRGPSANPAEELLDQLMRLGVVSSDGTEDAASLRKRAIGQAVKAFELAGEFDRAYPNHPRQAEVALLRIRLSSLATTEGASPPAVDETAAKLLKIAATESLPQRVRARASQDRLVLIAKELRAGRGSMDAWAAEAKEHLKQYPENPSESTVVSSLLAEMNELVTTRPMGGAKSEIKKKDQG